MKTEINQSGAGSGEIGLSGLWHVLKVHNAECWEESHGEQRGPGTKAILLTQTVR